MKKMSSPKGTKREDEKSHVNRGGAQRSADGGGLGTQGEHTESRDPEQMHVRLITCKGLHSGTAVMREGYHK